MAKKYINKKTKNKKVKKKTPHKNINAGKTLRSRDLNEVIEKRYNFVIIIIIILFVGIICRLFYLQVFEKDTYKEKLVSATERTVTSSSAPRGRIYDRNYNILVDNKAVKTIYYKKPAKVTIKEELALAKEIAGYINVDYNKISNYNFKNYWYINNYDQAKTKITDEEWEMRTNRKLSDKEIKDLIFDRITDEDLSIYTDDDKKVAYIYALMNKGYSYEEKIIKNKDVTEEEYAYVSENVDTLGGFNTKLDWERTYPNGDVFKSILGTVSSNNQGIPEELADYYLKKGYSMDDRVGISYLEEQYEDYLKGEKAVYRVNSDNTYELIKDGQRGNDIVLTIDLNLQSYLEELLTNEVLYTKNEYNTKYYNRSFAIISDPNTGEVLAMAGKQVQTASDGTYKVVDFTPGVVTLPVTPGSVVKGASMLVGYKYGAINIGTVLYDQCIKIKDTPEKCSWQTMGAINDIYALQNSSNSYQYQIAMKVGGANYRYNEALRIDESAFTKYRDMYASFGLGVKTGIDLPVESLGYSGKSTLPGHLLDFSIGQYDTYTPIQLSQYINTIASGGIRLKPYLLKEVYRPSTTGEKLGDKIYTAETTVLGHVDVEDKYINRVKEGFNAVVTRGLGYGYMGSYYNSSGKTGTSQSFIDTDGDKVVDTETITTSFVGYSPADNPEMSIVVVSPDVGYGDGYKSNVTKRISSQAVDKYFELKNNNQ